MKIEKVGKNRMRIGSMEIMFKESDDDRIDFMGCMIFADTVSVEMFYDSPDHNSGWRLEITAIKEGHIIFIRKYYNLPMHKCLEAQEMALRIRPDIAKYR